MFFHYLAYQAPEDEWPAVWKSEQALTAVLIYGYKDLGLDYSRMSPTELNMWILDQLDRNRTPHGVQADVRAYLAKFLTEVWSHLIRIPLYDGKIESLEKVGLSPNTDVLTACLQDSKKFRDSIG